MTGYEWLVDVSSIRLKQHLWRDIGHGLMRARCGTAMVGSVYLAALHPLSRPCKRCLKEAAKNHRGWSLA